MPRRTRSASHVAERSPAGSQQACRPRTTKSSRSLPSAGTARAGGRVIVADPIHVSFRSSTTGAKTTKPSMATPGADGLAEGERVTRAETDQLPRSCSARNADEPAPEAASSTSPDPELGHDRAATALRQGQPVGHDPPVGSPSSTRSRRRLAMTLGQVGHRWLKRAIRAELLHHGFDLHDAIIVSRNERREDHPAGCSTGTESPMRRLEDRPSSRPAAAPQPFTRTALPTPR